MSPEEALAQIQQAQQKITETYRPYSSWQFGAIATVVVLWDVATGGNSIAIQIWSALAAIILTGGLLWHASSHALLRRKGPLPRRFYTLFFAFMACGILCQVLAHAAERLFQALGWPQTSVLAALVFIVTVTATGRPIQNLALRLVPDGHEIQ